jgi:hypothetical protein
VPDGYRFYHYAPKADRHLRRAWTQTHSDEEANEIKAFAAYCQKSGVAFGVGLSPFEAFNDFNAQVRADFIRRVKELADLGLDELGIFFDDMKVSLPDLAAQQIEIAHLARDTCPHLKITVTPSQYSFDPVLERVFGKMPPRYLADLGDGLDPDIDVYWTGEEVCAREFSVGHLAEVAALLRRKPLLWDNYPVNDGPRMSQFLHLRGFSGRPARIGEHCAGHAVNPASQAVLSCIPARTLARAYELGDDYCYGAQRQIASQAILGPELAARVQVDLMSFQDVGLKQLEARIPTLIDIYQKFDHPAAREIIQWLSGHYAITGEEVQTQ